MRIVFIVDHMSHANAGTENQISLLLPELGRHHQTELICFLPSEWLAAQAARLKTTVRFFEVRGVLKPRTYLNLLKLVRHLRRERIDVVHTFFPVANIFGVLAARLAGVRTVVASRRDFGEWMSPRYLRATRVANHLVSGIITNSEAVKKLTAQVEKFPSSRIGVVLNGICLAHFERKPPNLALRESLAIPANARVIGLIGNMRPMKRQESFLRCAHRMLQARPDLVFLLVGADRAPNAPVLRRLQELIGELGIGRAVRIAAAEGNVAEFLSIMDVGVSFSQGEGFSNALMECMAFGIPCVASDSGGNPDLVRHLETGLLFPLDDAERAAAAIEQVLADRVFAQQMATRAKQRLVEEMTVAVAATNLLRCYATLS